MNINLKTNFPKLIKSLETLGNDQLSSKALLSAMNKTLAQGRTAMNRAITDEFAIKAGDVRDQIRVDKAKASKQGLKAFATLEAFGKRRGHRSRNVMLFGAKQIAARKKKLVRFVRAGKVVERKMRVGGGVSVKIRKAGGRKLIAGAFIANKGRTVFQNRPGEGRKIFAVETIDVPQMFNTRRINKAVIRIIEERFPRIFESEARHFLTRYNKG